jgi:hypothetical protein
MPLRTGSLRSLFANARVWLSPVLAGLFGMALQAVIVAGAAAQIADPPPLAHYLLTASAGVPLRLAKQDTFDQGTLAPAYTDVLGGYVFPGTGSLRHGAGLGLSMNLSEDGGFTEPVLRYEQFVIMPSYLLSVNFDPAWFALAHAGLPISVSGGTTVGAELAFAIGYRVLAGFGVFAEGGFDAFIGTASTVNPTLSIEGGFFLDYEVLP